LHGAGWSFVQALTFDLVGREDLANAVALNSSAVSTVACIGPVLRGFGLKFFGLAGCFYLNGLSFVAVVVALRMVRFNEATRSMHTRLKIAARCGRSH